MKHKEFTDNGITGDSYIKLLKWDLLLQKPPHHADYCVELCSCVLAIGDHFDKGQGG